MIWQQNRKPEITQSQFMLDGAERQAEQIVGLVRVLAGLVEFGLIELLLSKAMLSDAGQTQVQQALITIQIMFVSGLFSCIAPRVGIWRPWMAYVSVTIDALVVGTYLWSSIQATGMAVAYMFALPIMMAMPLTLASNALRLRPALQIYATVIFLVCTIWPLFVFQVSDPFVFDKEQHPVVYQFTVIPNLVRVVLLLLLSVVFILSAMRGRRLLKRAVEETTLRLNLGRYLPPELASLMGSGSIDTLKAGQRKRVTLLFLDIRGSTALQETLSPEEVVEMIGRFRNDIIAQAGAHGGIIDKFIGDGAFLVFGVPETAPDDPARAIACGKAILAAIAGWNVERRAEGLPVLGLGIGIHTGEAFVGAIGNDTRLEFTVLGDAVNVASRLEAATKDYGVQLLVSADTLTAAGLDSEQHGECQSWKCLGEHALRGRSTPLCLYTPADGAAA